MEIAKRYENYPLWIVILSNLNTLGIYALGIVIMLQAGGIVSLLYLVYVLLLEFRLIRYHCTSCYYFGKTCGFGQGRLSALFFKKGDISKFCNKTMFWKDMIPDLLISLIPLITGIVLLIVKFNLLLLFAILLVIALTTQGNAYIRGKLTCNYCKQRDLGCPANELFNKKK
ncbi:MAG TPA: hypothetical protein VIH57_14695 [Bacteroidales bacterium]